MTKLELKQIVKKAFKEVFGFAPTLKEIILLESNMDDSYNMVQIGKYVYQIYRCYSIKSGWKIERYEENNEF